MNSMQEKYPLNILSSLNLKNKIKATESQINSWNSFSQRTDTIADDLVVAFRKVGKVGREQFNQALEYGIESVDEPIPEVKRFFEAMDNTPYWVDFEKIELAQKVMSSIPNSIVLPVMIAFGLPASYIISKVNQTLIRSGELESKAASRLIETTAWMFYCSVPGGLDRYAKGFKTTAHVRLVHAYMRAGLNHLPDWDYEAWDVPINQTQQAITITPFLAGTFLTIPLGNLMSLREMKAIFHFWRYLSHLLGIHPEMQISNLNDFLKMTWLTFTQEVKTDEFTPRLGRAMLNAIPEIYGLNTSGILSKPKIFLMKKYHHQLCRLTLGQDFGDDLGADKRNLIMASIFIIAAYHFMTDLPLRLIPPLYKKEQKKRIERTNEFFDSAFKRLKANAKFNRENAKVDSKLIVKS